MDIYRHFIQDIAIKIYENAIMESTKIGADNILQRLTPTSNLKTLNDFQEKLIILLQNDVYRVSKGGQFKYKKSNTQTANVLTLKEIIKVFNSICGIKFSKVPQKPPKVKWNKKKSSTKKRSTKKRSTKKRSTKKRSTKKRSTKKRSTKKRSTKKRLPKVPLF